MILRAFILLNVFLSGLVAAADGDFLDSVARQLQFQDAVEGEFRQEKQLAFMTAPIVSGGHFVLDREDGLRWQVTRPVDSLMTVKEGRVLLDGQPVRDNGAGRLVARIMRSFMRGNLAGVEDDFDVRGSRDAGTWELALTPRRLPLSQVLASVRLRGDTYLEEITIEEQGGTLTVIRFSEVREPDLETDAPEG